MKMTTITENKNRNRNELCAESFAFVDTLVKDEISRLQL